MAITVTSRITRRFSEVGDGLVIGASLKGKSV
jgi:hypothetical protein